MQWSRLSNELVCQLGVMLGIPEPLGPAARRSKHLLLQVAGWLMTPWVNLEIHFISPKFRYTWVMQRDALNPVKWITVFGCDLSKESGSPV